MTLTCVTSQAAGYPVFVAFYNVFFHPLRKYPGPKLMGASLIPIYYYRVRGRGVHIISDLHEKYGPIVRLAPNELSYIDARAWKDIFGHHTRGKHNFEKDPVQFGPDYPGARGILRADEINHARQRRILSYAFSDRALKGQESVIQKHVNLLIKTLQQRAAVQRKNPESKYAQIDMVKLFNFTTFDVMGDLSFGESLNMLRDGEYTPWVKSVLGNVKMVSLGQALRKFPLLNEFYFLVLPKSLQEKRKQLVQFIVNMVDKRMASDVERPDIWSLVISSSGKKEISRGEMYSNAMTFMIAGTETTATALSGLTWLLCKSPDKLQKLTEEIRGLRSPDQLTISTLQRLEYLQACIEEGLRLYPPFPIASMRLVPKGGATVCEKWVPAGVCVTALTSIHSEFDCSRIQW